MLVQKNKNRLFNNRAKRSLGHIRYGRWLKKTLIRIVIVGFLLLLVLGIRGLNFSGPKEALDFIKLNLEAEADIDLYLDQAKKLSAYISIFNERAIEAIKMEDRLNRNFIFPIEGEISTYYNQDIEGGAMKSKGLIFTSPPGENIRAVDDGVVIDAGSNKSVGNYIIIKHSGEVLSVYKYMEGEEVNINEVVERGQVIGRSSGRLLLEVWHRNQAVDPLHYINGSGQQL